MENKNNNVNINRLESHRVALTMRNSKWEGWKSSIKELFIDQELINELSTKGGSVYVLMEKDVDVWRAIEHVRPLGIGEVILNKYPEIQKKPFFVPFGDESERTYLGGWTVKEAETLMRLRNEPEEDVMMILELLKTIRGRQRIVRVRWDDDFKPSILRVTAEYIDSRNIPEEIGEKSLAELSPNVRNTLAELF